MFVVYTRKNSICRNEVRENASRRWGGASDGCGTLTNSICLNEAPEGFYGTK